MLQNFRDRVVEWGIYAVVIAILAGIGYMGWKKSHKEFDPLGRRSRVYEVQAINYQKYTMLVLREPGGDNFAAVLVDINNTTTGEK